MAAVICILRGLPKDARVASFRFLKSTLQRYRNSKKIVWTVLQGSPKNMGFGNRTTCDCGCTDRPRHYIMWRHV